MAILIPLYVKLKTPSSRANLLPLLRTRVPLLKLMGHLGALANYIFWAPCMWAVLR
jgi:hypothetical protein